MKWDKEIEAKGKHFNFQNIWLGPYEIAEKIGDATYKLQYLQGDLQNLPINSSILKRYVSKLPSGSYGIVTLCIYAF